jgi:hypothetical protein
MRDKKQQQQKKALRFMLINFSSASSTARQAFFATQTLQNPLRHFLIAKLRGEKRRRSSEKHFLNCAQLNEFSTSKKMDLHHFRFINRRRGGAGWEKIGRKERES